MTMAEARLIRLAAGALVWLLGAPVMAAGNYGIGSPVDTATVAGWDIDVRPDGMGLPQGSGSAEQGEALYETLCASCHGAFGEGEGRWPALAGGEDTLTDARPEKTVGSYWPYATTLWDYIHRAMPFTAPQSLTADQTYALTAYVLALNDIIDEDEVLNQDNLATIEMPNRDGFTSDPRPDVQASRCMRQCKDPASIKVVESLRGVTPEASVPAAIKRRAQGTAVAEASLGARIYGASCGVCHTNGIGGAPRMGDAGAWQARLAAGREQLIRHAIAGYSGDTGVMPARGGNPSLTDEQVAAAVDHMLKASR